MAKRSTYPPSFSLRLIRWLIRHELQEEIEGNLIEYYQQGQEAHQKGSGLRYWFQVLNYLRPSTLKQIKNSNRYNMFIFNPLFTIRNLFKQGTSSLINVLGFALGLVCVFFLYFHIKSEMSYDNFHADKDKIYRALRVANPEAGNELIGVTSGPFGPALLNDFPNSIESTCRTMPGDALVTIEDQQFMEQQIILADSNFFSFFSYPLLAGTPDQVLKGLNNVVLTKETAQKFFRDEDPLGKVIRIDNQEDFVVSGIIDDLPSKSHLQFSMVLNINFIRSSLNTWWNNGLFTYAKIDSPEEADYVNSQLSGFMDKYFAESFERNNFRMSLVLEPLGDIYFDKNISFDFVEHGDLNTIYILGAVGIAILLIACFNYVNLSIAQSFKRAKEIAIRKVLGGDKTRLTLQFLGESLTVLLFATGLAVGLAMLVYPLLNGYFGLNVVFDWTDPNLLTFGGALLFITLVVAGLYPALLLSSFHPLKALKGSKSNSGKNVVVRKSLVIAQFLIAIFMISATLLISQQMRYIQNKDLGFNREAVVMVDINNREIRAQLDAFKNSFEDEPDIISATAVGGEPGGFHDVTLIAIPGKVDNQRINIGWADEDYFETFEIEMVSGRSFAQNLESDEGQTAVINQKAMEVLGLTLDDVLETRAVMTSWDLNVRIVGVAKDYHFSSLKNEMEPLIIINGLRPRRLAIKVNANNLTQAMAAIQDNWEQFSPEYPIEYNFLDDSIGQLYEKEAKQNKVFSAFSAISIFLACMGVFGLATYTARQRQKELGIRKVLGASARQIIGLLSKEFVLLIVVASVIAIPVAWFFMARWLSDFAYQISIASNWPLFLFSGIAVLLITFLTIGAKTYSAAVSNPTESIRYE